MALLWAGGAELQSTAVNVEYTANVTTAPVIDTVEQRSGNACWRIFNTTAIEGFRQQHTAVQGQFFFQFYLKLKALPTAAATIIGGCRITGSSKVNIRVTSGGLLQLWNTEDAAQVGADSSALSLDTIYRIAMMYDSTTLASTAVEARAYADTPGAAAFWNPSGTVDLAATPTAFGCYTQGGDTTLDYIVDDCTINDTVATGGPVNWNTWPPENKLIVLRPNGNGDNSTWVGSDADSTDNYLLINQVPPQSTTYVEENTTNADHALASDDYNMDATPAAIGSGDTINAVMVGVYVAVSDATGADPDIMLRIKPGAAGTVDETATLDCNSLTFHGPQPLPGTENYAALGNGSNYEQPGGASAWTKAALDTMQCGVFLAVTDTHFARVGALWAYVSFTPVAGGAMAGTAALTFGQSGAVAGAGALAGTGALLLGQTGAIAASGALAGTSQILFGQTGTANGAGALAGMSALVLAQTGALSGAGALAGTSALVFGQSGTLDLPSGAMAGLATMLFGQTGALAGAGQLAGLASILFGQTGTMSGGAVPAPGTRDVRRAKGRGLYLSDAPERQTAAARSNLKSEG